MRVASLLAPDLKELLNEDPSQVRELLEEIHPEDIADLVAELDPDDAAKFLAQLPAEDAAPIFERLEGYAQEALVDVMPPESVAQIASEMAPDDRADFFSNLPEEVGEPLLEKLERVDPEAAEEIREIEKWPSTSAGHLMTTSYVSVPEGSTVHDAIEAVRVHGQDSNAPVYNVYAVTTTPSLPGMPARPGPPRGVEERVIGVASVRDLLLAKPTDKLMDVAVTNILSVPPDMDQEEVARRMAKYDLNVMPVVDDRGQLLGVITIDDIIDVLTAEQTEDVQKLGAVEPLDVPYFRTTFWSFIKKRGVWLTVLFLEEFFTQTALRYYDPVFEAIKGAAYYVPLLISTGGNSGSQSSTLVIRGMAVGEIKPSDWWRILFREALQGLVLGSMLAVIGFGRVLMYKDQGVAFAFTIALTLIGIVMTGCTVGSMLPLVLKRFGVDPATSSTPFIASLVDVLGIVIFVHVAQLVMARVIAQAATVAPIP